MGAYSRHRTRVCVLESLREAFVGGRDGITWRPDAMCMPLELVAFDRALDF